MNGFSGPIKNLALGIYDGPHATPPEADEGPVFLGIKNVTAEGRLDLTDIRHLSEEDYPKWTRRVEPQPNDIVFSYEATLHRYVLIPEGFRGCLGRRMALVRPDPEKVEPRFLHYFFLSRVWKAVIESNIISGATVDRIPISRFPDFEIKIPGVDVQRKIADILSAYDDLIENNRRRIHLLEQAARLLFREWFVYLKFPGHEKVRVRDGVPEGWERIPLEEICWDSRKTVSPSDIAPETPYIGLEHIPRKSITLCDWDTSENIESNKYQFEEGDILFGKIRPYLHKVGFALTKGVTSSDAIVIRPMESRLYNFSLFLLSGKTFVTLVSKTVREGSKMPRADWKFLQKQMFLLPDQGILSKFDQKISPIVDQLKILALQNQKLAEARDLLLPRLMNGEIAV